jgi:ATP-binding cassette, subfamily B (MDR/TAP), member 1
MKPVLTVRYSVFLSILIALFALPIIAPHFPTFATATSAAGQLIEVIERESKIDSQSAEGITLDNLKGDIEVRDLTFAYPSRPDTNVLNNLSLKIPAKKVTALVGASGSGKSTIIGLLERWADAQQGGVYLDGVKIQDLNLRWLRRQIGLVQQEPVLFNNTVYNNVAFGLVGSEHENAPEEKKRALVKEACIAANAHDFVSKLPQVRVFVTIIYDGTNHWIRDMIRRLVTELVFYLVDKNNVLPLLVVS